jgi:hypothetical protein
VPVRSQILEEQQLKIKDKGKGYNNNNNNNNDISSDRIDTQRQRSRFEVFNALQNYTSLKTTFQNATPNRK